MKKKILIPTDFSKHAWNALNYAIALFEDDPCEFYLLNTFRENGYVLESMMVPEPGEPLYEKAKEQSQEGLDKIFQQIVATKGIRTRHKFIQVSKFNFLSEAIKFLVKEKEIDITIMGTKGITDAASTIYGSNTVDVMEQVTDCPVIAVPANTQVIIPKEIVFPTNYKRAFTKESLQPLLDIMIKHKSTLKVLHVVHGEERLKANQLDHKKQLGKQLEDLDFSFHTLDNKDVHEAINCFVESRGSNMVAFMNRKHSFFGSILSRPLVKNLGYYSKVPVMALPLK